VRHFDLNNILTKHQSGFRTGNSTKDHLFQMTKDIIYNFNNYEHTGSVMFDLEKAFDKVLLDGLLYELQKVKTPDKLYE
jgi:hypothetical protein